MSASDHYTIFKRGGQYICAATSTGSVQLLNPKTFAVLKTWKAHQGWINDMDANTSFLVTCGGSPRQHYGDLLDPLAKVFDLKTLMPLPPVAFHTGAAYVRLHPRMVSTGIIAGTGGQLQVLDIMSSTLVNLRQLNLLDSHLTGLEIAPSGEALALSDSLCCMQLWGSPSRIQFPILPTHTEFADIDQNEKPVMDWHGTKPLHTIGTPYYRETLLSAWPSNLIFEVGVAPMKIDPVILTSLVRAEIGGYAPNIRKMRRNQVNDTRSTDKTQAGLEGPKFRSEQAKDADHDTEPSRRMSDVLEALQSSNLEGAPKVDVPLMYRNVEIKYSKFGVDDFDFAYYNSTNYSGLETHIANSYANSLLQLLKFTPLLRNYALHHTSTSCLFENCLLCEMGFLIDMLEKARGQNCQATNFLKTFTRLLSTTALSVLDENSPARPLTLMIQSMNEFLLEKLAADFRQMSPQLHHIDVALTTFATTRLRCGQCAGEIVRGSNSNRYFQELIYPPRTPVKNQSRNYGPTFSQILKSSVERQEQIRGYCDRCKRYQQIASRRTIQSMPPVLMINAAVQGSDAKQLWAKPRWLPQEIGVIVDQGQFFCYEGQDLKMHLQRGVFKITVYELIGVVADINSGESKQSHLVSLINISSSLKDRTTEDQWHLFNDFLVRKISSEEALHFDPAWKLPSVLTYQVKSQRQVIDDTWKDNLDTSLLYRKWPLSQNQEPSLFRSLSYPDERPRPGTAVGIDAEFVALQQEELEIKADGSRSTLRPSLLGLARVSVLRGDEALNASDSQMTERRVSQNQIEASPDGLENAAYVPFIDDYIHISDPIVDYLTAYSGIHPGDLSPTTSPYVSTGRLVSLKIAYKKMWLLLNLGCVFVGHGLPKDFRTINMHVPSSQVIDTVELFFDRRRSARKLSLRFLTWVLFGERVQIEEEGNGKGHDSIVDARMALRLWRKWRELEEQNMTEDTIRDIYKKGRETGFKVPERLPSPSEIWPGMRKGMESASNNNGGLTPPEEVTSRQPTPAGRSAGLVSVKTLMEPGGVLR